MSDYENLVDVVSVLGKEGLVWFCRDKVIGFDDVVIVEAKFSSDFECAVPASDFGHVLGLLDKTRKCDMRASSSALLIESEGLKVELCTLDAGPPPLQASVVFASEGVCSDLGWYSKVLKRILSVTKGGVGWLESVVCLDRSGVFGTDGVRACGCFADGLVQDRLLVSAEGLKRVLKVVERGRSLDGFVNVEGKCVFRLDGGELYVCVLSYDFDYPDVGSLMKEKKEEVRLCLRVDEASMDRLDRVIKIFDEKDIVLLVVQDKKLKMQVDSVKGIKWEEILQDVEVGEGWEARVFVRDLKEVLEGIVEVGFLRNAIYLRSVEGVEYIIVCT